MGIEGLEGFGGLMGMLGQGQVSASNLHPTMSPKDQEERLAEALLSVKETSFKEGELVTQKAEYRMYRTPKPGQPAIVVKAPEQLPKLDKEGSKTSLNPMVIFIVDGDGTPIPFVVDAFRFERYERV